MVDPCIINKNNTGSVLWATFDRQLTDNIQLLRSSHKSTLKLDFSTASVGQAAFAASHVVGRRR